MICRNYYFFFQNCPSSGFKNNTFRVDFKIEDHILTDDDIFTVQQFCISTKHRIIGAKIDVSKDNDVETRWC